MSWLLGTNCFRLESDEERRERGIVTSTAYNRQQRRAHGASLIIHAQFSQLFDEVTSSSSRQPALILPENIYYHNLEIVKSEKLP